MNHRQFIRVHTVYTVLKSDVAIADPVPGAWTPIIDQTTHHILDFVVDQERLVNIFAGLPKGTPCMCWEPRHTEVIRTLAVPLLNVSEFKDFYNNNDNNSNTMMVPRRHTDLVIIGWPHQMYHPASYTPTRIFMCEQAKEYIAWIGHKIPGALLALARNIGISTSHEYSRIVPELSDLRTACTVGIGRTASTVGTTKCVLYSVLLSQIDNSKTMKNNNTEEVKTPKLPGIRPPGAKILLPQGARQSTTFLKDLSNDFRNTTYMSVIRSDGGGDESQYLDLLRSVFKNGSIRVDRTMTGTVSAFVRTMRFDLSGGRFPLLTTKRMPFRMIVGELLWFLSGSTDANVLAKQGIRIWNDNTSRKFLDARGLHDLPEGDIGAGYGFQWRHFGAEYKTCNDDYNGQGVDQIANVLEQLRNDPFSRRICFTGWNPQALDRMALPPCHSCFVQFYVSKDPEESKLRLSCSMYQRSADSFLGLPFNIASYALLTAILAEMSDMVPHELVITTGDTHIYNNHWLQVGVQLQREPLPSPLLKINPGVRCKKISEIVPEDIELSGYLYHPGIPAPMAV